MTKGTVSKYCEKGNKKKCKEEREKADSHKENDLR